MNVGLFEGALAALFGISLKTKTLDVKPADIYLTFICCGYKIVVPLVLKNRGGRSVFPLQART